MTIGCQEGPMSALGEWQKTLGYEVISAPGGGLNKTIIDLSRCMPAGLQFQAPPQFGTYSKKEAVAGRLPKLRRQELLIPRMESLFSLPFDDQVAAFPQGYRLPTFVEFVTVLSGYVGYHKQLPEIEHMRFGLADVIPLAAWTDRERSAYNIEIEVRLITWMNPQGRIFVSHGTPGNGSFKNTYAPAVPA